MYVYEWKEMKMSVGEEEREAIRRAYYVERKSQRQIAKEGGRSRKTVKQIVEDREVERRERKGPSVYEPYRARVEELLEENEQFPSKQRYTASKIYELIRAEGYSGCESRVRKAGGEVEEEEATSGVLYSSQF
jgi:transposase